MTGKKVWLRSHWWCYMACCLLTPIHYLNQCWLTICEVCGIHMKKILLECCEVKIFKFIAKIGLKSSHLKLQLHLSGVNEVENCCGFYHGNFINRSRLRDCLLLAFIDCPSFQVKSNVSCSSWDATALVLLHKRCWMPSQPPTTAPMTLGRSNVTSHSMISYHQISVTCCDPCDTIWSHRCGLTLNQF